LRRPRPEYNLQCSPMAAEQVGHGTDSFCLLVSSLLFIELG
jgi:hypothetical protein